MLRPLHPLRNLLGRQPLRSMQGFAHAVLTDHADQLDAQGRDYLDRISTSALRLDKLILEALTYSRIGRSEITAVPIDLDQLMDEVMHTYQEIRASDAEISVEHPLLPVLGSRPSLAQCVSNLLTNAVKFVDAGTKAKVRVWTEKHDSTVRLFVQDNGIGIPKNFRVQDF